MPNRIGAEEGSKNASTRSANPSAATGLARERLHLDYLDGLRALACMFVAVHHVVQMSQRNGPIVGPLRRALLLFDFGHFAVSVFIVISGFCLMLPTIRAQGQLRGGAKGFFLRRAKRILPPYYVAMTLTLAAFGLNPQTLTNSVPGFDREVSWVGIGSHVLLLHNLSPSTIFQINNVFWSIAVEWQIYLVFPACLMLWRRVGAFWATSIILVLGYAAAFALRHTSLDGLTPQYLGLFAVGMLAAEIGTSPQLRFCTLRERIPWTWLAVTLGVAIAAICYFAHNVPQRACDLAVALFAAALLVAPLSAKGVLLRRVLSVKPLVFLGAFAYSTYLLHLPLLRLLAHSGLISFTKDANGTFLRLVSTLPVVVLGCYVFYLAFERPFITSPAAAKPALPVGNG